MRGSLKFAGWALIGLTTVLVVAIVWLARPLAADELKSQPIPARNYSEASRRINEIQAAERSMPLQSGGRSYALLHGSQATTSVVVFHGYTDVPEQFTKVAVAYYKAGYNVWVPRMPFHGYLDRMTDDPSRITPDILRQAADENIDIAVGLGQKVEVIGISGGGALATWAAAERADVGRTVILSPVMLPKGYQPWMVRPLTRLVALLPDSYIWWTEKEAAEPGPEYPRYSRHGITSYLMMVERAKADGAHGTTPISGDVVLVSNLNDEHLDTEYPISVIRPLMSANASFASVVIPASEELAHDLVGVAGNSGPRIKVSYQYLAKAFGIRLPDPLAKSASAK